MISSLQKLHLKKIVCLKSGIVLASLWVAGQSSIYAQDAQSTDAPPVTPKTPIQMEAEEAAARATIAESKYKEEKAKKDLTELNDLKSDFTPEPAAVTTKDNAGYYGELLSFATLEKAARLFVESIPTEQASRVIVSSDFSMAEIAALWNFADSKLTAFEKDFPTLFAVSFEASVPAHEPFVLAPEPITTTLAALGAASQLAAFFKVKQEFSGRAMTPSSEALKSLVVKTLLSHCHVDETNRTCFTPVLPELVVTIDAGLVDRLDRIRQLEKDATQRKDKQVAEAKKRYEIDLTKIDAEITEVKEKLKNSPTDRKLRERHARLASLKSWWEENSKSYSRVTSEFSSFMSRLEGVPEGASQSPLERLFLYKSLVSDNAKILIAKALSQGADMETSTGALRKTKISFVGGSAAVFFLADLQGTVILTDVIPTVASRSFTTRIESASASRVKVDIPDD